MIKIVVLSGAGMSAESGLKTFRDSDGLWENYAIEDVATPSAFQRNPSLVLKFYNERRQQVLKAQPNAGHIALAELENKKTKSGEDIEVQIVTQNIDDLHERAGSTKVLHLHGEILKARSTLDPRLVYHCKEDMLLGDKCEKGSQLRPHIVWFHEPVPLIDKAAELVMESDILMVVGTSLAVYPAAGLINYSNVTSPKYLIDPNIPLNGKIPNLIAIEERAGTGVAKAIEMIISSH